MAKVALLDQLHWLGHDTFRLESAVTIYFDPLNLPDDVPVADVILISHEHADHCSPQDVARIRGDETVVIASAGAARKLTGDVRVIHPGEQVTVAGIEIRAVPAYNVSRFRAPGQPFHPREAQHVGYLVTTGGETLYFAGDTDHIPEMADIDCDVALLPVGGTYTMDAPEAAQAAAEIDPQVAVPMHWGGGVVGTRTDAEQFEQLYKGEVAILPEER